MDFWVNHQFFHVMIWTHPIETTISKWMFRFPGRCFLGDAKQTGDDDSPWLLPWFRTTNFCTSRMVGINDNKTWPGIKLVTFLSRSAFGLSKSLVRFPEEKNHPKNLGMLKKDSELMCRSENCVFEKVLVIVYLCIYLFFFRKRCFKRFWEKNNVTMESMRCFYLDLCMWRICRSCLIHTRDLA